MHSKKRVLSAIILVLSFFNAQADNKYFSQLLPVYENGECKVFYWIERAEKRQKVEYVGSRNSVDGGVYCLVKIPVEKFEKDFQYCALSGITNNSGKTSKYDDHFKILFAGGTNHPEGIYFFEWYDARNINPKYSCVKNPFPDDDK